MQNNVTEITQRLLRSLDNNYNVVNMPAVIEIISILEKVAITKELLETTRLGKYVNELRRRTTNEQLSKRAKELVKKWKSLVLPETNGQIRPDDPKRKRADSAAPPPKRAKLNGQLEHDFSDNSNSSFKDARPSAPHHLNSDSNSSFPTAYEPLVEDQLPKKRGRKKGSKNHKNLLDEAESSFTNKLAVSRGNSKVKTTQELIAGLQNKGQLSVSPAKQREDLVEKAAKLTERVSIIDKTLYTNSSRYKQRKNLRQGDSKVDSTAGSSNDRNASADEEIIVVDDVDHPEVEEVKSEAEEPKEPDQPSDPNFVPSLTLEQARAALPPIDYSWLDGEPPDAPCSCRLEERAPDDAEPGRFEFVEDASCLARERHERDYRLGEHLDESLVARLGAEPLPNVNGNYGVGAPAAPPGDVDLYENVVPNVYSECKLETENYKKYVISEDSGRTSADRRFSEWHEVLETPSYGGDAIRVLPYVIID